MEALTAAAVGLLTVYDMVKAVDRGMTLGGLRLEEKRGGKSGVFRREIDQTLECHGRLGSNPKAVLGAFRSSLLKPWPALAAAWNKEAFGAKTPPDALKGIGASGAAPPNDDC